MKSDNSQDLLFLDTSKLTPHPDNSKHFHDIEGEEWEFFKADIKRNGIIQPLLVTGNEEGGYTVLSGHQRLRAAKALELDNSPCIVLDDSQNQTDVLFGSNLSRRLTTLERYRITIHLLDKMEDSRKNREKDEKGRFRDSPAHTAPNGPNGSNGKNPRNKVSSMVPGVTKHDIQTFRKIKELPAPVQQELFRFVEKENPNKKALKQKVNQLNGDRRRLKTELRAEKKVKLKKKELEQLEAYVQTDIDPRSKYDAKCFDETNTAINKAIVDIPRIIAEVLAFKPLRERTAEMLRPSINALVTVLLEQHRLLRANWEERDRSMAAVDAHNDALGKADL